MIKYGTVSVNASINAYLIRTVNVTRNSMPSYPIADLAGIIFLVILLAIKRYFLCLPQLSVFNPYPLGEVQIQINRTKKIQNRTVSFPLFNTAGFFWLLLHQMNFPTRSGLAAGNIFYHGSSQDH